MKKVALALTAGLLAGAQAVSAEDYKGYDNYYNPVSTYEITVTNVTKGQAFTPILAATHKRRVSLFEVGSPASPELAALAEGGDTSLLNALLEENRKVSETVSTEGLLLPGQSTTFEIQADGNFSRFSLAAMLIPTNDTFVALNGIKLPRKGSDVYQAAAYDAGSEQNDELCANIPGPACGGAGVSANDEGEGFVHVSAGIHGEGDLQRSAYDWRDSVARVTVRLVD